jgi:signal transduction histidine kinase
MELGADDYVVKPFQRLDLLRAIQTRLTKKAAQDEELQNQLSEFKAVLAHERGRRVLTEKLVAIFSNDFRNPVAIILTATGFLRDSTIDEGRRTAHLGHIESSARHLLDMLDDMLVVGQIESGRFRFSPQSLDVAAFFEYIVDTFRGINGEMRPIAYESHFIGAVEADARLLRQIAVNLIAHVVKSSPPDGAIQVTLDELDGEFALTVQGTSADARLFTALQNGVSHSDAPDAEFGLSVVRQAVELHGGSVQLENQDGVGTAVTVTIPIY